MKNLLLIVLAMVGAAIVAHGQTSTVSGEILSLHQDAPVSGVSVQMYLNDLLVEEQITAPGGAFTFTGLTTGETYRMEFEYATPPIQGLSTLDMVLIAKHILGVQLLPTPLHLVAADFNNSGQVSVMDIVRFRRVILAIEAPEGEQWVFLPASYGMVNSPDLSSLQVNSQTYNISIYAIKRGDVSD